MSKVFENYRSHPALKYDGQKLVFKIDDQVYLIEDGFVKNIKPIDVEYSNIGEPFRKLARLSFVYDNKEDYIDFEYRFLEDLKELL